jgi:hypothetical protein
MSKTKEQVNRYLTHCKFPDDDWSKILLYCRKNGLGYAHKAAHPKSESTFDLFVEWFRTGYGSGDVIRYGHTIGILSTCTPSYSELCAYLSYDGQLIIAELQISTDRIIAPAKNDARKIYGQLRMSGLDFDERLGRICKKKLPALNTRIAYRHDDVVGYGVIDKLDDDVVHFLFGIENNEIKKDFNIPLIELSTSVIDKDGLAVISATLNDALLRWNPSNNKLEKLHPRAKMGETYWYITDKFSVSSAIENKAPTSDSRYEHGNYFINHSDAVEFLTSIQQIRKQMTGK